MCFTNLPIEFDEEGNPYLNKEEMENVEQPDCDHDHGFEDLDKVGTVEGDPGPALADLDSDEVYDVVVDTLPESAREQIAETDKNADTTTYEPAKGD